MINNTREKEKTSIAFCKVITAEYDSAKKEVKSTTNDCISFEPFLEEAREDLILEETQLSIVPIKTTAETILNRTRKTVNLTFTVYSSNREEAINNYEKLLKLKQLFKPTYKQKYGQYATTNRNIFGLITAQFKGLPSLENQRRILPTNFQFDINKDMGYILVPYKPEEEGKPREIVKDNFTLNPQTDGIMIPVSYTVRFEGKVLLELSQSSEIVKSSQVYADADITGALRRGFSADKEAARPSTFANVGRTRDLSTDTYTDSYALVYWVLLVGETPTALNAVKLRQRTVKYWDNFKIFNQKYFEIFFKHYDITNLTEKSGITEEARRAFKEARQLAEEVNKIR